jgi:hypothetical protein
LDLVDSIGSTPKAHAGGQAVPEVSRIGIAITPGRWRS